MRKTLKDVACYLKETLVPLTIENYAIKSVYTKILADEDILKGVPAFRDFLCHLYDTLAGQSEKYDTSKKVIHEYENRTGLSVYYPFLHYVNVILQNIGYFGVLNNRMDNIVCNNSIFNNKLSVSKNLECLQFLTDCGLCFNEIDINDKKQKLSDISSINITYSEKPIMFAGLKILSVAERDFGTLDNQDIFLRCDYRILKENAPDTISIVKDTIQTLSADIQTFVQNLHKRYLDMGMNCVVEIKGFHIYIKYSFKRKDIWGLNVSLNNGYHINVKPLNTDKYVDKIKTFSPFLHELIAKGYGCGRKREIGHCDGGCRGLTLPLDNSILTMQNDIELWLDQEISCLK